MFVPKVLQLVLKIVVCSLIFSFFLFQSLTWVRSSGGGDAVAKKSILPTWCELKQKDGSPISVAVYKYSWDVSRNNSGCEDKCVLVDNPDIADVILFLPYGPVKPQPLFPQFNHSRGQVLALWTREPREFLPDFGNAWSTPLLAANVSLAMTYNLDSNLPVTYGPPNWLETAFAYQIPSIQEFNQRRPAVWLSTNCNRTTYPRPDIVQILQRFIEIDCLGKCLNNGPLWKGGNRPNGQRAHEAAVGYRLMLGFEKSIDQEYITEKFFNPFRGNGLLVYIGSSRASFYAPGEHSYIDALTFPNATSLGLYLRDLVTNYNKWVEYFEWRRRPAPMHLRAVKTFEEQQPHLCRLCACVCNQTCNNGFRPGVGLSPSVYDARWVKENWIV